jgi:hypothetical protein
VSRDGWDLDDRVAITDHGVVTQIDPETGEQWLAYVVSFTAVDKSGVEHGITVTQGSDAFHGPGGEAFYRVMLHNGVLIALHRAGLGRRR